MTDEPYSNETARNTATGWLDNQTKVDTDLDGMIEFGKSMMNVKANLEDHIPYLQPLTTLPSQAWATSTPEAGLMSSSMLDNYSELRQYLTFLGVALNNIAMASQTIADAYSGTDGWSAASLSTVLYAFGDVGADRPAGLPPFVTGETFWSAYYKNMDDPQSADTTDVTFGPPTITYPADGNGMIVTKVAPDGRKQVVTISWDASGAKTENTKILSPDGKVLKDTSKQTVVTVVTRPDNTRVVTTLDTMYVGDKVAGTTFEATTTQGSVVTNHTVSGTTAAVEDGKTVMKSTGSQTTTTDVCTGAQVIKSVDADGTTTQELHIGAKTPDVKLTGGDTIGNAQRDLQEQLGS